MVKLLIALIPPQPYLKAPIIFFLAIVFYMYYYIPIWLYSYTGVDHERFYKNYEGIVRSEQGKNP